MRFWLRYKIYLLILNPLGYGWELGWKIKKYERVNYFLPRKSVEVTKCPEELSGKGHKNGRENCSICNPMKKELINRFPTSSPLE
jgi:hypothetical protein